MARTRDAVLVVGLGRFGMAVAEELSRTGTDVLGVDRDLTVVQRASSHLANVVAADATDVEAVAQLGVDAFARAVVAISRDQEASILATANLADAGVPVIWAKALNHQHARILRRVGAHHVVQPEHDSGERVAHLISGRMSDYLEVGPDWVLAKTKPPSSVVGIPLGDLGLRKRRGVTVVAVRPAHDEQFTHTDSTTTLAYGDDIMVMGRARDVESFVDE